MDCLNELEQEVKFTLKTYKRDALNHLLANPLRDNSIVFKSLQEYQRLAINFLTLYGSKMLVEMVKDKRKLEVDHTLMTLHLDYGIWQLERESTNPHLAKFKELELINVEERFQVIEQSFTLIFEDWNKILDYFKPGAGETESETKKDLVHMAKLIPSLLTEQGRIEDAIQLITNIRAAATKVAND